MSYTSIHVNTTITQWCLLLLLHRRCTNWNPLHQTYGFENKVVKFSYQTKRLKKQRIVQQKSWA